MSDVYIWRLLNKMKSEYPLSVLTVDVSRIEGILEYLLCMLSGYLILLDT